MHKKLLNDVMYEMAVVEIKDSGDSTNALQTIVEESETPVKKYRVNLAANNPLTMARFTDAESRLGYLENMPDRLWDDWYEDPEPEEESE
jgi:hypothetical protein